MTACWHRCCRAGYRFPAGLRPSDVARAATPEQRTGRDAARSVLDLRDRAKLVRGRRTEAEELEIGRDLLEEHVDPDLNVATALHGGTQERRRLLLHHHFTD